MLNLNPIPTGSTRARWPNNFRSSVALAFDVDGPTGDAMLDRSLLENPRYFTEGAFGPWRALPRLLDLLEEHRLTATFFIPTWVVNNWTAQCLEIIRAGHEIGYHGHIHECFIDLAVEEQRAVMTTSREIFETKLGVTPTGFRTPSGDWSPDTADLLADFGVQYSSSMRGDDRPYFHTKRNGDRGLVEIPGRWDIDDYTALAYFEDPDFPSGQDRISDYEQVARNWIYEFEGFHSEGLCWTTILHPKVCAKPGRLEILNKLFTAISAHDDVWATTCGEIAHWWIEQTHKDEAR
ncbi:polysaccharide deacetylase family protein [Rhizobium paranaense]|uniref:Chitooligosaccharide deacetylase n=2 Tax=Rhizobium TaxID=379 RepID=A0A7W9D1T6_9HYPH|nr:polysaccharide deacetylase [Rhizobium paranaense]MBB5574637.1 peptidoglycan/xylan/chitin deacetylase (PgdA/CDA1 family) [Rhizobium paranaense]